jgi:hypothetical protein
MNRDTSEVIREEMVLCRRELSERWVLEGERVVLLGWGGGGGMVLIEIELSHI